MRSLKNGSRILQVRSEKAILPQTVDLYYALTFNYILKSFLREMKSVKKITIIVFAELQNFLFKNIFLISNVFINFGVGFECTR